LANGIEISPFVHRIGPSSYTIRWAISTDGAEPQL